MGGCASKDRMKKRGTIGRLGAWRTEVRSARLLSLFSDNARVKNMAFKPNWAILCPNI